MLRPKKFGNGKKLFLYDLMNVLKEGKMKKTLKYHMFVICPPYCFGPSYRKKCSRHSGGV